MVRIVQSYETMLEGVRKAEFQKETFQFYQLYWEEERDFRKEFEFSLANKKKNREKMEKQDKIDILTKLENYEKKVQKYRTLLKV